tara:strand:+ start:326 stop:1105 length:780 start_codon:yes stop_codon:yes gene_type:complete
MIISKIIGGLGNQMFQYAYARNLSLVNNTDFYLDTSGYNNQGGVTHREFTLTKFPNIVTNLEIPNSLPPLKTITDNFVYDPNSIPTQNCLLDGYWQSEKYFKPSKDTIIQDFSIDYQTKQKLTKKYPSINGDNISLHIRRGDYVHQTNFHPIQSIEYYKKALDILGDYDNIFVFSDDIPWCKDNLSFNNMVFVGGNVDIEDLWLMSLCKKNIIVNSSFSWWGAYLNTSRDKVVISPSNWFGPSAGLNSGDIIPDEWNKI